MADVYFKCACGRSLAVDEKGVGLTIKCADCGRSVKVPAFDIKFTCEQCQTSLLAPMTIVGDQVKCTFCGHRLTVPKPVVEADAENGKALADNHVEDACAVKEASLEPAAKRCMDALMRQRSVFRTRSSPAPEPTLSGWLFRLALLAVALVTTSGLVYFSIQKKPSVSMSKESGMTALAQGIADMASERHAVTETAMPEMAEPLAASIQEPSEIPETVHKREMTGKIVPPSAGESVVMTMEPPQISVAPPVPASVKIPARDRTTASAGPGAIAGKVPDARMTHPTKLIPPQAKSMPEKKHVTETAEEKEARYAAMRVMHLKKQVPELQALVGEAQKLNALVNYKSGWKQSPKFWALLRKCMRQVNEYTQTHSGKDLDDFYWSVSYWIIYGHAMRTARSYEEAERIMREGWALLEGAESDRPRAVPRAVLHIGMSLAQDWLNQNPLECALLLDELEGMALEFGMDKVSDIWRVNAPHMQVRFMQYADKVPETQRTVFFQRHKQRLERYLLDDSIRLRNRASMLRGWIVFLDGYGELTEALPIIHEWPERYGDNCLEMNYYFSRFWVELYGEGDWDKAAETVRLATQSAQRYRGGKLFDEKNYVKLTELYYDLQRWPGYELKRQRTIERNKTVKKEMKTAFLKEKTQ